MLSQNQERLIRSLHTGSNRQRLGLCLVEGEKSIREARDYVELLFNRQDCRDFDRLVTTETPQNGAAVARIPKWTENDVTRNATIIVLDGVQDPGNVGSIVRLCRGFGAGLVLIESAEPSSPKVIRSSAGAIFHVPWVRMSKATGTDFLSRIDRPIFRLEKWSGSVPISAIADCPEVALIAGSEGKGIKLKVDGQSVAIDHDPELESLNVSQAAAIALYIRYRK
ncbi:RNA methyltransferase [Candidatus Uhrbacteria bacterium]|nr:RNA methyltransferase [Candidatus Uhrbacteria bacterium]